MNPASMVIVYVRMLSNGILGKSAFMSMANMTIAVVTYILRKLRSWLSNALDAANMKALLAKFMIILAQTTIYNLFSIQAHCAVLLPKGKNPVFAIHSFSFFFSFFSLRLFFTIFFSFNLFFFSLFHFLASLFSFIAFVLVFLFYFPFLSFTFFFFPFFVLFLFFSAFLSAWFICF